MFDALQGSLYHMLNAERECRPVFLYWGRRGAMTRFTLEAGLAALRVAGMQAYVSISRQNEDFECYHPLGSSLHPVNTFEGSIGALTQAWRIPLLRRNLLRFLKQERATAVIDLMPHVWVPFVLPAIRRAGVPYLAVVHEADAHPGDWRSRWQKKLSDTALRQADRVITLSDAVSCRLASRGSVPEARITTLFLPDLGYARPMVRSPPAGGLRVLDRKSVV